MPQEPPAALAPALSVLSHRQSHSSVLVFILMAFFGISEVLVVPMLEGHAQDVTRIVLYVSFTYSGPITTAADLYSTLTWALFLFVFSVMNVVNGSKDVV